jgi:TonB family protein
MKKIVFSIFLFLTVSVPAIGQETRQIDRIDHVPGLTITVTPRPEYPQEALERGVTGTVVVDVLVNEQGKVESAEVKTGHPLLTPTALSAALKAKIIPNKIDNTPIKGWMRITYWFNAGETIRLAIVTLPDIIVSDIPMGHLVSLPQPVYPPAALAVRASGTIIVAILIDQKGNVEKAEIVSGHPLLRAAAVKAALKAKFVPATLSGTPVKARSEIHFRFGDGEPNNRARWSAVIPLGQLKPRAKTLPMPQLINAADLRIADEITVRIRVNMQQGTVVEADVVSDQPLVHHALLAAARAATFEPVLKEFPPMQGIGYIKYTRADFNKSTVINKKPRSFLIIVKPVLNSRTVKLVKPKGLRVRKKYVAGRVEVAVLVSMEGEILAANAISGPEELHEVSEKAAMESKFSHSPVAGGNPFYVKGIIVYNFKANGKVE